jgi:hypothetical protein
MVVVIGILTTCVRAAEPGDWNWGIFLGELGASAGLSYGLAYAGTELARHDAGDAIAYTVGVTVGSATGVLLVGGLFDGTSGNKPIAYTLTIALSAVFPTFYVFAIPDEGELHVSCDTNPDFPPRLWLGTLLPPVAAGAATLTYNIVKKPEVDNSSVATDFSTGPYAALLADNSASPVPVYGVTVSF